MSEDDPNDLSKMPTGTMEDLMKNTAVETLEEDLEELEIESEPFHEKFHL